MLSNGRFAFKQHPRLEGTHAILGASNHHWLRYTDEKLVDRLKTLEAAAKGTRLHAWAAESIALKRRQPEDHDVLSEYVNHALDFDLVPEQLLFYSIHAYGTADTIGFEPYDDYEELEGFLRIHDYKSGTAKTSADQLYIYAGYFCHEYNVRPFSIDGELRIYQGEDIKIFELDREYLAHVYGRIEVCNEIVEKSRMGGLI